MRVQRKGVGGAESIEGLGGAEAIESVWGVSVEAIEGVESMENQNTEEIVLLSKIAELCNVIPCKQ